MSWSIDVTGTKEAVKNHIVETLNASAKSYNGGPEASDILCVMDRAVALVDALDLTKDFGIDWNAVIVKGNGSHSRNDKGVVSANFQLSVVRTSIKI